MDIKTLVAECTAYDFKVELEERKPKSWLKSVSAFADGDGGVDSEDVLKDVLKELSERQRVILAVIASDVRITIEQLSGKMSVNERTIRRDLSDLQEKGLLKRVGGRRDGHWVVTI